MLFIDKVSSRQTFLVESKYTECFQINVPKLEKLIWKPLDTAGAYPYGIFAELLHAMSKHDITR